MTTTVLAWLLTVVLLTIAGLHAYWGFGGKWPGTDQLTLARKVVGTPGIDRMPPRAACLLVAVVLLGMGFWPLQTATSAPTSSIHLLVGIVWTIIFLARGIAGYLQFWRRQHPEQPFADLDRRLYSPLCLALGIGFSILVLKGIAT